jgi:hypothetical protein
MLLDEDEAQTALPLVDTHLMRLRGAELIQCCREIAKLHGWDRSAAELDASFNPEGRSVSVGVLRNGLHLHERNYARLEWAPYFATLSDEPAQILATAAGKTLTVNAKLKPEDELEILRDRVAREFGLQGARLVASVGGKRR